jgi:acetyl esterase/lipase
MTSTTAGPTVIADDPGSSSQKGDALDDVDAVIERLSEPDLAAQLDLDNITLIGHSSGGHLALWALDRPDATVHPTADIGLGAIVDLAAFSQATQLLGGTINALPDRYDQAAPTLDPERVSLIHGADDT